MEEEGVVMPPPPVLVVEEEGVVHPPPLVVVEEEVVVVQPPPLVEEEEVAVQPPPMVVEEEVVVVEEQEVVHPPPVVVAEEEEVVQPPPVVVVEEQEVLQPPPVVVVEEEEVVQPPPMVVEEEVVVQPPPLGEEEEEVVAQPPPLGEEEAVQEVPDPDPHALLLAQWVMATLGNAEHYRHVVATRVEDYVIPRCEAARGTLLEVAEVLLQEPIDAAETIYTDMLEDVVSRGMNSLLIGPAANIVDSLFNWPGPLAGATDAARDLVHATFYYPEPEGGPLEEARRELGYLFDVAHADAARNFSLYAAILGFNALPGGQAAYGRWVGDHVHADTLAREALQMLNYAVERSIAADLAVRLCGIMPASRVRPGVGPLMPKLSIAQVRAHPQSTYAPS